MSVSTTPLLQLQSVTKTYAHPGGEVRVLTGVECAFRRSETVAVIGPSGSGKSTLLALMAGLDRPTSGKVSLLGQDLSTLAERQLTALRARHLGIVFQQFHLMAHLTARENVALPLDLMGRPDADAADAALAQVGLGHRLNHYPHELSGGECQRTAIARALVVTPEILLADEPSGNLDQKTGDHVMALLFELTRDRGTTLVLVTHNEALAQRCDRRLLLRDGKLVDA